VECDVDRRTENRALSGCCGKPDKQSAWRRATTAGGSSASGQYFTYEAAPTITKVTPSAGPTTGGSSVTPTGTNFVSGATTVTFGGTVIPTRTSQVRVSTAGGTAGSGQHYTYETVPTITRVTPGAGPSSGGTVVTLTGSGFVSGGTTVTFGGTTIPSGAVTFVSTSRIKVTSPVHVPGAVTVFATTAGGTSGSGEQFTYEAAPTITKVAPVKSISRAKGIARASFHFSGPTLTMRSSPTTAKHMLPPVMKHKPPNIFRSDMKGSFST
jgi:hypothetical protein